MPRVVLSGGPGVGKTTVLRELARMDYRVFHDSARAVIQDRKGLGLSPRPDAASFAREILARDAVQHDEASPEEDWTFFDRSALEPIGILHGLGEIPPEELHLLLRRFIYHRQVFVFPPWQEIYVQDEERDHTYEHCVRVHHETLRWYMHCGYEIHQVQPGDVGHRVEEVLNHLGRSGV